MSTNPLPPPVPPVSPAKLTNARGQALAYRYQAGRPGLPAVVYLHGYASDMGATKAEYLAGFCAGRDQSFLRFDYSGNGASEGDFATGTIGHWIEDALAIIDGVTQEDLLLVGSSMGGWIGLHCAQRRSSRVKGFIGIAAAPDFTEEIWLHEMTEAERAACRAQGFHSIAGYGGEPLVLWDVFLQDGRDHLLLDRPIALDMPIILLQGRQDREVPWETAFKIRDKITPAAAGVIIVEDGDHRLSRPQDLEFLGQTVAQMSEKIAVR